MNEGIKCDEVRVSIMNVDVDGGKDEALGVLPLNEALAKAKDLGVDLILINQGSDPPVAKIAEYSKYRYNMEKKSKEKKKNAKSSELKEVKMSYKIDKHDYEVRKKNASKFLTQGNRVKCTVMFRGREIQHDDLGRDLLVQLSEDLTKIATMEGRPKREGRNLSCFLLPRAEVLKAIGDKKRADEKAKKARKGEGKKKEKVRAEDGSADIAAAVATEAATAVVEAVALDLEEEDDDDESLDDLLGGDDLTDDLFG
jgi:translation initiation factor IF-3